MTRNRTLLAKLNIFAVPAYEEESDGASPMSERVQTYTSAWTILKFVSTADGMKEYELPQSWHRLSLGEGIGSELSNPKFSG